MLSFEHVSYRYPGAADQALTDVSLAVAPGEHVVLLGANGSGKSTIARLANGLLLPDEGTVRVNDLATADKETLRTLRSQVGVVVQDPDNQIISTTVLDELAFGPENLGLDRDDISNRVDRAISTLGLEGFEERDPNSLSGGEKQRVVIAGMLTMNPSFLVLDEPTSRLDRTGRAEVRNAINSLNANGRGILHITHDLSFCREAHKVLVLKEGRLVFAGQPSALLNNDALLVAFGLKVDANQQAAKLASSNTLLDTLRPVTAPSRRKNRGGIFPSLYLNNVHFTYGQNTIAEREVLKGVNLSVGPGSYTLISGQTGSGKSTLLRVLAGLLEPHMGSAAFSDGSKIFPSAVGIVFQNPESQIFAQSVEDEIAFGPDNLGLLPSKEIRGNVVREALEAVGLDPKAFFSRSPFTLSGGEMHRVAIASILAMRPTFLLLDEPTAGLDAEGRAFVHGLIEQMVHATTGVIVVSHEIEEFEPRVQAHLMLREGRLWRL
jgi:energy-coupling factor transport system ATP-binding protein